MEAARIYYLYVYIHHNYSILVGFVVSSQSKYRISDKGVLDPLSRHMKGDSKSSIDLAK